MTTKAKLGIVALFSCCAMIGMGFASWTISQGPAAGSSAEVTGTVSAENVVTSDQFIRIKGTPSGLTYTNKGFQSNGETSLTGTLSVSFQIDVNACKPVLGESSHFSVTMKLNKEVANNLFASASYVTISPSATLLLDDTIEGTVTTNTPSHNTTDKSYIVSGTLGYAKASAVAVLTVTYNFAFTSTNFTKYFYTPFTEDSELAFLFGASLTGGGN